MMSDSQRSLSVRLSRRGERSNHYSQSKDAVAGFFSPTRLHADYTLKKIWKAGFLRLLLVGGIVWMLLILFALLFHVWSCQSSLSFFSAICNKEGRLYVMLDTIGFVPKPQHRCPIPVDYDPDKVLLPSDKHSPFSSFPFLSFFLSFFLCNQGEDCRSKRHSVREKHISKVEHHLKCTWMIGPEDPMGHQKRSSSQVKRHHHLSSSFFSSPSPSCNFLPSLPYIIISFASDLCRIEQEQEEA